MTVRAIAMSRLATRLIGAVLLVAALPSVPVFAAADDGFPTFKHGEWSFTRRGANVPKHVQDIAVKECLDPGIAIREQNAMLGKAGCKFDAPKIEGSVYTYTAKCDIPNVGKMTSTSVLTRESDSAYSVAVESDGEMKGKPVKSAETLFAKRVGKCPKQKK